MAPTCLQPLRHPSQGYPSSHGFPWSLLRDNSLSGSFSLISVISLIRSIAGPRKLKNTHVYSRDIFQSLLVSPIACTVQTFYWAGPRLSAYHCILSLFKGQWNRFLQNPERLTSQNGMPPYSFGVCCQLAGEIQMSLRNLGQELGVWSRQPEVILELSWGGSCSHLSWILSTLSLEFWFSPCLYLHLNLSILSGSMLSQKH